jgi:hypothetical protein
MYAVSIPYDQHPLLLAFARYARLVAELGVPEPATTA